MAILRSFWALLVFLVATPIIATGTILWSVLRRREATMAPVSLWSRALLAAIGARVEYLGLEHRIDDRPCIFVSNHQSNVDIWVLGCALPLHTKFVAKQSLFAIPFLGSAMRRAGFISIDRERRRLAMQSLDMAAQRIREGASVILFPEGTRSKDGRLQTFKKGGFHLAMRAGVPVVPIAISGSWDLLPPGSFIARSGTVNVRFLPAVDVSAFGPDNYRGLLTKVHEVIGSALGESATSATAVTPTPGDSGSVDPAAESGG
jgi:1-acyl-sn-glycerol-3-phosphate acyltransferase